MKTTALQLGDTVSGFYFGEHPFAGKLTMVDGSFIYITLTSTCHRYPVGDSIAIARRDMSRCALKTVSRPESVEVAYDASAGVRYV